MLLTLTLRNIMAHFNPAAGSSDKYSFCLSLLPDHYNSKITGNLKYSFDKGSNQISDSAMNGLMRGNRKSVHNLTSLAPGFTADFIEGLRTDRILEKINTAPADPKDADPNVYHSFRGNFFLKILRHVRDSGSPASKEHSLFHLDYWFGERAFPEGANVEKITEAYDQLQKAIQELLKIDSTVTRSYAIMLLVITAIVQDAISDLRFLYKESSIAEVMNFDLGMLLVDPLSRKHRPFCDPHYLNSYYVYLLRTSDGELWDEGTLVLKKVPHNDRPEATLCLKNTIHSPLNGEACIERKYVGTPMLSPVDQTVYIAMAEQNYDTLAFLSFDYSDFKFAEMYFRLGFLQTKHSVQKRLCVRRILITARKLKEEELPYARGLLKMEDDRIILTPSQLKEFSERFRDYTWYRDYVESFIPLLESHKRGNVCMLHPMEILRNSLSDLDEQNCLRILLALKSVDSTSMPNEGKYQFTSCLDGAYKLFK